MLQLEHAAYVLLNSPTRNEGNGKAYYFIHTIDLVKNQAIERNYVLLFRNSHDAVCFVPNSFDIWDVRIIFEDNPLQWAWWRLVGCEVYLDTKTINLGKV